MNRKTFIGILIILITLGALLLVNRDLFHFTYDERCERTFTPGSEEKWDYPVSEQITLKPGAYMLSPVLQADGPGSGLYLIDDTGEEFFFAELDAGTENPSFPFEIRDRARQIRMGIRYDPARSAVRLDRIRITADHILYKESLLRHLTLSLCLVILGSLLILRFCFPSAFRKTFPLLSGPETGSALGMILVLTLLSSWPLFDGNTYIHGEDMFFHLTRIKGLAESLRAGYFPVRDQLYWLHNYGYGVGFYYPDVFLYLPAVLVLLGFHILTAYKVFLVLCSFFSILSAWYAASRITGKQSAACITAVFLAFSAYRLSNIYYRGALGETQAAIFYPLIILGLYEIFHGETRRWPLFAFGFLGLLSCHIISLTIGIVLTAVFLLTRIRRILTERDVLFALLRSVLTVLCLGAFFWIPMLEQVFTNPDLRINSLMASGTRLNGGNYAFPVTNLFARFRKWYSVWQAASIYPGWPLLLTPLMALLPGKERKGPVKAADFMLVFSLICLWMCTRAFPWRWEVFQPFVTRIQFAYRLLLPVSVMLSLCCGIYFSAFPGFVNRSSENNSGDAETIPGIRMNRYEIAAAGVLALFCFFSTAFPVLQEAAGNRAVSRNMFVMQDNRVSGEEYLPRKLSQTFPGENADTVFTEDPAIDLNIISHDRQKLSFRFTYEISGNSGEVRLSVPLIYYTGYQGTLTADDGTVIRIPVTPDSQGLTSVSSAGFSRGTVFVEYKKTAAQRISEFVTLLSLALYIFTKVRRKSVIRN